MSDQPNKDATRCAGILHRADYGQVHCAHLGSVLRDTSKGALWFCAMHDPEHNDMQQKLHGYTRKGSSTPLDFGHFNDRQLKDIVARMFCQQHGGGIHSFEDREAFIIHSKTVAAVAELCGAHRLANAAREMVQDLTIAEAAAMETVFGSRG